jgi:hypothetical protein
MDSHSTAVGYSLATPRLLWAQRHAGTPWPVLSKRYWLTGWSSLSYSLEQSPSITHAEASILHFCMASKKGWQSPISPLYVDMQSLKTRMRSAQGPSADAVCSGSITSRKTVSPLSHLLQSSKQSSVGESPPYVVKVLHISRGGCGGALP